MTTYMSQAAKAASNADWQQARLTDNQNLLLWESSKWMEGAAEANTAIHDGKSLALAIFEEFPILLFEGFTVLVTFRNVKMSSFK